MIRQFILVLILLVSSLSVAQKKDKALIKSNDFVYQGNEIVNDDFVLAEMEYRKAISEKPTNSVGAYNLGNAYYKNGKFSEAILRHQEAVKSATTKTEKHKAFHNIGNTLMQNKQCKEAVEAFKNALRNNPNDDETRYNLGLAKECAKDQGGGEDQNEDKEQDQKEDQEKEENKDKKDEGDEKEDNQDEGEQDEKDGDEKEDDKGKPKDEKEDKGEAEKDKKKPKPQQGQLSPQQIKNLLEAMNDQEQKVQEKINAKKAKGVKVQTDKDW